MINTKLQNIIDTKSAIGNAIVNKGGTITSATPFYEYAGQIDNISTGGGSYSTFVAQAQDNSKYTVYNGYHAINNPTPNLSNNFAFNQWVLNNSATGDVIFSNVITSSQIFTVPFVDNSAGINEVYMPFVNNTDNYGGNIFSVTTNNGFIYVGGQTDQTVKKFHESNLVFVGNTVTYNSSIFSITINNGFIYVGGALVTGLNRGVAKYHESNLVRVGNTVNFGGSIYSVTTNNGFIYVGGIINQTVQKFNESTLAFVGNTVSYTGGVQSITTNNGFIYVGGGNSVSTNRGVTKFHEGNLALVGANLAASSTVNYGGNIQSITTNNGFIYVGGETNRTVQKFHESNLVFVGNTVTYNGNIQSITTNNGFIYAGGQTLTGTNRGVAKYHEDNLVLVSNTANYGGNIYSVTTNNGFIYAGGLTNQRVQKFVEKSNNLLETPVFEITTIKEQ
jgi:hypothetical protein